MAYTRVNWEDLPSTATPRNATNLNKMDAGIKENDDKLLGNAPMGSIVVEDVNVIGKNILNFKDSSYWGIRNTSSEVIFPSSLAVNRTTNTNTRFIKKIPIGTKLTLSARVIEGIDSFESGWTQIGISLNYTDGTDERKILSVQFVNKTVTQCITFTTEKEVESIDVVYGCNIVVSNSSRVVIGLMLEPGTEATPYTPFKNYSVPYFQDLTSEIVYHSNTTSKGFTLWKYGNILFLQGYRNGDNITANNPIITIPSKYITIDVYDTLRFSGVAGSELVYSKINPNGDVVCNINATWFGVTAMWIINNDTSTDTQSASTMSLRPDTTEE